MRPINSIGRPGRTRTFGVAAPARGRCWSFPRRKGSSPRVGRQRQGVHRSRHARRRRQRARESARKNALQQWSSVPTSSFRGHGGRHRPRRHHGCKRRQRHRRGQRRWNPGIYDADGTVLATSCACLAVGIASHPSFSSRKARRASSRVGIITPRVRRGSRDGRPAGRRHHA
jgi:hypothetical protein